MDHRPTVTRRQRGRRQAAHPESSTTPRRRPRQGIHSRPRSRRHRPPVRNPARLPRQRQPSPGIRLLVDRVTGRISPINLPEFDAVYSAASWYRDYAAYCGVSEDGKKLYAVVAQISRRKPVLNKPLDGQSIPENAIADSACPTPAWQRSPARVTFEPGGAAKQTFAIRGHAIDLVIETEEPENEEASR